jgi:hypothetical protein
LRHAGNSLKRKEKRVTGESNKNIACESRGYTSQRQAKGCGLGTANSGFKHVC